MVSTPETNCGPRDDADKDPRRTVSIPNDEARISNDERIIKVQMTKRCFGKSFCFRASSLGLDSSFSIDT